MSTREDRLVETARRARRWFRNRLEGGPRSINGDYDDILIARDLEDVLLLFDDVEACHDLDRAEQVVRREKAMVP